MSTETFCHSGHLLRVYFPIQKHKEANLTCRKFDLAVKKVNVNPRSTFDQNFVGPKSPMLHTKPQGHWPVGSEEEVL